MRDKDYYENAPLDWSRPTNAVPGVEDIMRMREAEERARAARAAKPEPPILTARGFGGRSSIEYVPKRVYTVPGVGEDFSKMFRERARERQREAEERARAAEAAKQAERRRRNLVLSLQAHALDFIEGARRAGMAARDLCRDYLARERPRLESRDLAQEPAPYQRERQIERNEEKRASPSPTP